LVREPSLRSIALRPCVGAGTDKHHRRRNAEHRLEGAHRYPRRRYPPANWSLCVQRALPAQPHRVQTSLRNYQDSRTYYKRRSAPSTQLFGTYAGAMFARLLPLPLSLSSFRRRLGGLVRNLSAPRRPAEADVRQKLFSEIRQIFGPEEYRHRPRSGAKWCLG